VTANPYDCLVPRSIQNGREEERKKERKKERIVYLNINNIQYLYIDRYIQLYLYIFDEIIFKKYVCIFKLFYAIYKCIIIQITSHFHYGIITVRLLRNNFMKLNKNFNYRLIFIF